MLNSVEQTLFESTNAKFALKINVMTTKKNTQTNQVSPLITLSQMGNAKIRPNAFLVFTYMTEEFETSKSVYTSNPHMPKIKAVVRILKDAILSGNAFIAHDHMLSVNDAVAGEYWVQNIGTKQHAIMFKLRADAMVDVNNNFMPAVEVRLSEAPEASILSLDEFLAVYEIIEQVNLPLMAMEVGLAELILNNKGGVSAQNQTRAQNNNYGNNSYNGSGARRNFSSPAQAQPAGTYQPQQAQPAAGYQPAQNGGEFYTQTTFQPKQATQQPYAPRQQDVAPKAEPAKLQPRSKPMVNGAAVEDVQVDDLDLGDTGLSEIFG